MFAAFLYNSAIKPIFDNVQYLISALNSVFAHEIFSLKPFNAAARSAIDSPSPFPPRLLLDFSPRTKGFFKSLKTHSHTNTYAGIRGQICFPYRYPSLWMYPLTGSYTSRGDNKVLLRCQAARRIFILCDGQGHLSRKKRTRGVRYKCFKM